MLSAPRVCFLPGAAGAAEFWRPVGERLPGDWSKAYHHWPGLGAQAPDPDVRGFEDLVRRVAGALAPNGDLVAQSLGGIVAVGVAARHPHKVRRLVLAATSGGIDLTAHGARDWRADYRRDFPAAAPWILDRAPDLTGDLARLPVPTMLLWGEDDEVSPVAVGERLAALLPRAALHVIPGGTHDFARERPGLVARLIAAHLG
ncbi:MAG: hypothetical protein QOF77_483 [Solirubrobacteraceae bacterium]|nr:hypothetical protein [Solirubrobacteraceae bacterium]